MTPPDRPRICPRRPNAGPDGMRPQRECQKNMNAEIHPETGPDPAALRRQLQRLAALAALLAVCFGWPLLRLVTFAAHSELFSCILLVPFISGYLIWSMRKTLNLQAVRPCWPGAALAWTVGGAILAAYGMGRHGGWTPQTQDYLALMTAAFLCCFWGVCLAMLGSKLLGQIFFPLAFLVFAVPIPTGWLAHIDTFFQYTSAATAEGFFRLVREPLVRDGLILQLSSLSLRVAPECSGIHSTWVLLMTSFLAGYLFLPRYMSRAVLIVAVIPLAILRNGFRVFVLGWVGVHWYPNILDTPFHHHGGPIFFALSLIPFFLLLLFLRRRDARASKVPINPSEN
jgi:exosortase C (VPDSG-CTERM-specific)